MPNRYARLIEAIFLDHYASNTTEFEFARRELEVQAEALEVKLPKNLSDVVYSFRHRNDFPDRILDTQPEGLQWIIEGAGRSRYRFRLVSANRVQPRSDLITIPIPDSTPEIIRMYALRDEQALLAVVRYNRLIDTFLGLTTYSLQNHLRTTVKGIGQIEIDEVYVGIDKRGCHYVIPVQAKGGKDQIGIVQTSQDIKWVEQRFPEMKCKAVAAQFMTDDVVALFELTLQDNEVRVVDEKHYRLVPWGELDLRAIASYRE